MKNKTKYHTVGKVKSRNKRGEIIMKLLLKINKMHVNRKLKRGGGNSVQRASVSKMGKNMWKTELSLCGKNPKHIQKVSAFSLLTDNNSTRVSFLAATPQE